MHVCRRQVQFSWCIKVCVNIFMYIFHITHIMSIILIIYRILASACALHMPSLTVLNIQKPSIFSQSSRRPACRPPPPAHPPLCTCQIVVSCRWTGAPGQTSFSHGDLCAFEAQPFQRISLRFDALSCRICFCSFLLGSYVDVDLWICECVVVCLCGTTTKEIAICIIHTE